MPGKKKEKTYLVTLLDLVHWSSEITATSKEEAIAKAREYVRDGSDNWRTVRTVAKAEIKKG